MERKTLSQMIDHAVELLRNDLVEESSAVFVQIQERSSLDQTELRRAVLSRSRSLRISDRDVVRILAASRVKADMPGDPSEIPRKWRRCSEIGYIVPTSNVPSILDRGIICHNGVQGLSHEIIADNEIQNRRANRDVGLPNGRTVPLHNYANLYLNPRNAMMYRVRNGDVAVVMVDAQKTFVLPGARVSPRNAAVGQLQTYPLPSGLRYVDPDVVYSDTWNTTNGRDDQRKQAMQAEILVPDRVPSDLITQVAVRNEPQRQRLLPQIPTTRVEVAPVLFFD